jgi:hypothetical protein
MPFCTKQTHISLHWGKQQQHNLPLIIFLSVFYLIFVFELFSPGQWPWLLPPMEVAKLQHQTKISLWRSDDGLIPEKSKAEVYLGSMESKHTTRFTRKKRAKKPPALFTFWPILALEALLLLNILDTIFCPLIMLYSYWHNV